MAHYSPAQFDAIRYVRLLSSPISIVTTSFFIGSILVTSQLKLTLPMRRIIISFCIYGLIHGLVNLAPVFYHESHIRKACSIEGFFGTISNAGTSLYLTSILVYYYCTIKLNMTDVKFKRKVEGFLHVFINIYCFTGAIVIATSRLYFTDDIGICDVRPNPSCATETSSDISCKKENIKAAALRWVFSDALIVLNFLYIVIVWKKVNQAVSTTNKQSRIRRFGAQSSCNSTPNTTSQFLKRFAGVIRFSENSRTSKSRQQLRSQYSSFSRNRQQSVSRNSTTTNDQSNCNIGEDRLQMTRNEISSPSRPGILRSMSRKCSALDSNISDAESNCRPSRGSCLESVENIQSRPSSSSRRIPDFNLSEVRSKASEVISPLVDIDENDMEGEKIRRTSVPKRRASTRIQIQKELISQQSKLFISFYILIWMFPLCCHIAKLTDRGVPFALMLCSLLLNPLVGSLGCFLYCFPHIMSKVRTRDTSWCSAAFEVLKKGGDGDRIGVSRRRNSVFDQDKGGNVLTRTIFKKMIVKRKKTRRSRRKSKQRNCLGLSVHDIESLKQLDANEDENSIKERTSPLKKTRRSREESKQRNCLGLSVHDIEALKQLDVDKDESSTKDRPSPLEFDRISPIADIKSAENADDVKKIDMDEQLNYEQGANDEELCHDKVNDTQI